MEFGVVAQRSVPRCEADSMTERERTMANVDAAPSTVAAR